MNEYLPKSGTMTLNTLCSVTETLVVERPPQEVFAMLIYYTENCLCWDISVQLQGRIETHLEDSLPSRNTGLSFYALAGLSRRRICQP